MELCKPVRDMRVSEIEREAKRAVVDAVEERWKRAEAFRRRAARRKFLRNAFAVLLLLAIAVGGIVWYQNREDAGKIVARMRTTVLSGEAPAEAEHSRVVPAPLLDGAREKTVVEKAVETVVAKPDPAAEFRVRYMRLVSVFTKSSLAPWNQVPAELRPKNAPPGTVYHALVPRHPAGYDIYAMTTGAKGMTYDLLSPIADAVRVSAADFKAARANAAYLIEKDGRVWWGGKATAELAKALQSRLQAANDASESK